MRKYNYTDTMRLMRVDIPNPRHGVWCARDSGGKPVLITHQTVWRYDKQTGTSQYSDGNLDPDIKPNSNWAKAIAILREAKLNHELVACPIVTMKKEPIRYENRDNLEEQAETKFGHWGGEYFLAEVADVNDTTFRLIAVDRKEV